MARLNPSELLQRELENKKSFDAMYDTTCMQCGGFIAEGEPFYFFGNKEKTCQECLDALIEYLKYGS